MRQVKFDVKSDDFYVQNYFRRQESCRTNDDPPRSDGCLFFFNILALQKQCRTQQLRELGSDLGTRHLLQVGRSSERRLHSYVDHITSGCNSVYEPAQGTPRNTVTLPSPQPALICCLSWDVTHNPNEVLLLPIEIHLTLRTPCASGYAQTHTRRFTSDELPHCSIAAGLY